MRSGLGAKLSHQDDDSRAHAAGHTQHGRRSDGVLERVLVQHARNSQHDAADRVLEGLHDAVDHILHHGIGLQGLRADLLVGVGVRKPHHLQMQPSADASHNVAQSVDAPHIAVADAYGQQRQQQQDNAKAQVLATHLAFVIGHEPVCACQSLHGVFAQLHSIA